MVKQQEIKLFEEKRVRSVWDSEAEGWFFSVVDVVEVLTDSANPTDYLKKLRKRELEFGSYIGTNCLQVAKLTPTGKKTKDFSGYLRTVVSNHSVYTLA